MDVRLERVTLALRTPLVTAFGDIAERELLVLTLAGDDGVPGYGEAAPLEAYDGVPAVAVEEALQLYARVLQDARSDATGPKLLDACREIADLPQALAAVDLALWDRAGRRSGRPISRLLADAVLERVPVNATIGAMDRAGAASRAAEAVAAGFTCIKVKVGAGDDAGRIAAVRAAVGPEVQIRIDANGVWSVEEAVAAIEALAPAGLELVEEPVHGVAELRAVRERVAVRVAMDETAAAPGALGAAVADAVCLKISRCGGLSALLAQAALVRAGGAEVYLGSTFDGPLGVAAAVHAAAALRVELPCGLATLGEFEDPVPAALEVSDGYITVPGGPGLGVGHGD
jgi:L-alanine-DL-glutamate epimerase-like enolase superfamily enzyme